jgi:ketosteroid isomerase-like protein
VRASDETLDWIRSYYATIDEGRFDDCAAFLAPDASLKIAHNPLIKGRDAIAKVMRAGLANVKSIRHAVTNAWEEERGEVVFEVEATYTMPDDVVIVVPGVVIAHVEDGVFLDQRIAADLTPVYGRGK